MHVNNVDGTQMAAKIEGTFVIDANSFEFLAIAFGRIGGQNIGVKLSDETENKLKALEYNVEEVIDEHYEKQINQLKPDEKILKEKIKKFRLDELHHKDIAYKQGASKKGFYSIFDKIIKTGSKVAINISEKI